MSLMSKGIRKQISIYCTKCDIVESIVGSNQIKSKSFEVDWVCDVVMMPEWAYGLYG